VGETVDRHTYFVWGSENPCDVTEHECDSLKVSVWCALIKDTVIGSFFFSFFLNNLQ